MLRNTAKLLLAALALAGLLATATADPHCHTHAGHPYHCHKR